MKRILLVLVVLLLVAVIGAAVYYFVLGAPTSDNILVMPDRSMEPTLRAGERVVANPRVGPAQGRIVLYAEPDGGDVRVGRIIATGGQTVDLVGGRVLVDGRTIDEPYRRGRPTYPTSPAVTFPVKISAGDVWILGDNRETNKDSRQFGAVSASSVKGVVTVVYWPLTGLRVLDGLR